MTKRVARWGRVGIAVLALGFLVAGTAGPAEALSLGFDYLPGDPNGLLLGGIDLVVDDNSILDINPLLGVVSYSASLGAFVVNVSTAISDPLIGPYALDLNSVNVTTTGGTITILATDSYSIEPGQWTLLSSIGGTLSGAGDVTALQGTDDLDFIFGAFRFNDAFITRINQGPFGPGAFSSLQSVQDSLDGTFSITDAVTVSCTGPCIASYDIESRIVPGPASLVLLGIGLFAAGLTRRRFLR